MDPRFDTSRDPRFKRAPTDAYKVKVDKRFAHMFDDKNFVETPTVDPRGRKVLAKNAGEARLRRFYSSAADEKDSVETTKAASRQRPAKKQVEIKEEVREAAAAEEEEVEEVEAEEEEEEQEAEEDGEAEEDDSDDDSDSDDEDVEDDGVPEGIDPAVWESMGHQAPRGDATRRFAVMGCDWDHVSAADVLVLARGYLTGQESHKSGAALRRASVEKVAIYPSDFGLQQLALEAQQGPQVQGEMGNLDENDEEKGNEVMRKYQLQRTKYYYAVVYCDAVGTASWLYDQLDGLDADGICPGLMDLRFIPDDLEFPHAPTSEATEAPKKYKGPAQISGAGHSKVKCTWDETPANRRTELMRKKFSASEMADMDLKAYLASSSEEEGAAGAEELRKTLGLGSDAEDDDEASGSGDEQPMGDMEATFNVKASQLEDELGKRAKKLEAEEGAGGGRLRELESDAPKGSWQQYLEKRKDKRKQTKAKAKADRLARQNGSAEGGGEDNPDASTDGARLDEPDEADLDLLAMDAAEDDRGFNVRGKKTRRAGLGKSGDFKVDVTDPRIAKVFSNPDFEIDPNIPEFTKSEGMKQVLKTKRTRQKKENPSEQQGTPAAEAASLSAPSSGLKPALVSRSTPAGGGLQLFAARRREAARAEKAPAGTAPAAVAPAAAAPATKKAKKAVLRDEPVQAAEAAGPKKKKRRRDS